MWQVREQQEQSVQLEESLHSSIIDLLKEYSKNPIGGGAEAVVVDNTPTTVGKMTSIPVEEMAARYLTQFRVSIQDM